MQQHSKIVVGLPHLRIERDRLAISFDRQLQFALFLQRDSHVVINFGIVGVQHQSLCKGVDGRRVALVGMKPQPQKTISIGVFRIEAERSARLCNGVVSIFITIENV